MPEGNTATNYERGAVVTHYSTADAIAFAVDFLRRRFWILFLSTLFGATLGVLYFVVAPTTYVATATLGLDSRVFQLFPQAKNLGEQAIDSLPAFESQLEILKSENIALKVITDLRLAEEPEYATGPQIPFVSLFLAPRTAESEPRRTHNALRVIEKNLKIKRVGASYLVEIQYESLNPENAAKVANAVADAYLADQLESRYKATRLGSSWLEQRIKELRNQVAQADEDVLAFKAANTIVDAGGGRLITDQQLTELNSQLTAARAKTSEARARVDQISTILKEKSISGATIVNVAGDDQAISKLRSQYLELAAREDDFSKKVGPTHLAVAKLQTQMRAIDAAIQVELRRLFETYRSDFKVASESEKYAEARVQQAVLQSQASNAAQIKLRELEATAKTYKSLYDQFLHRYTEAYEQQSFANTEARLITRATMPFEGNGRRRLAIAALTPFLGLLFGVALGALRDFMDRGFRTSNQVERLLNTNCIALVPLQKASKLRKKSGEPVAPGVRTFSPDQSVTWTVLNEPLSRFAEAIRSVKLAAELNKVSSPCRTIGITSSVPGEGKSTIAAAIAQSAGQNDVRVILVDLDLRNPTLTRTVSPEASRGILEVLNGRDKLEDVIWKNISSTMAFLPAVVEPNSVPSSEILASSAMRKLFERLGAEYDYIIVDLPPLAPIVDVRATTDFVDSYILVVEWGRTYAAVAQHALSMAPNVYKKLLGAVFNKVEIKSLKRYDGDRARYYHDKSYTRYGYSE